MVVLMHLLLCGASPRARGAGKLGGWCVEVGQNKEEGEEWGGDQGGEGCVF